MTKQKKKKSKKEKKPKLTLVQKAIARAKEAAKAKRKEKVKKPKKPKKIKKAKKQSNIIDRKYVAGEVSFPIYVFNSSGERTVKIKSKDELHYMGLHLGTTLTCVRDGTKYSNHYFSYNKSINVE